MEPLVPHGNKAHPNIWVWVEFFQEEDLQMSITVEKITLKKYLPRSRQKEINKDLQIAKAKVKYLQT